VRYLIWKRGDWLVGFGLGGREYLSASCGILGGTAGDEFGIVVLEEVFVEGHVFFFGEDGVVGFDAVFLEEGFISVNSILAGYSAGSVYRITRSQ